jgi:hypothetical protein
MKNNNNSNSNKKPKKNGRKIQLPSNNKPKKLKLKVKETVLPASNYNGGGVISFKNDDNTTTGSTSITYTVNVDATNYDPFEDNEPTTSSPKKQETTLEPFITSLPNKEEVYSKYTDFEEEEAAYNNSVVPKANNDGVKTMIIIAGALSLIAFLALVLS